MATLTSIYADRASLGVADGAVPASPLRLGALAAPPAGAARLALDAAGNVTAGVLTVVDIPPVFVRRDVNETIEADWTWAAGKTIAFAPGTLAPPAASARSVGTRLVIEPVAASTEYAIGRESGALWTSVPATMAHRFYQGAIERLRLDTDGTLRVLGGSGAIVLQSAADGNGSVAAVASLGLTAAGAITFASNGQILPAVNYRENLGAINRKYLSLHAAELWVETLVAADTMATIGGRILVGPTTVLTSDLPASGAGAGPAYAQAAYVKHNQLAVGDWLWLEAGGAFEIMQVTAGPVGGAAPFGYTFSRNRDGSGLRNWYAGDAVFNTGTTSDGFIDLYSQHGVRRPAAAGPTIVGNVRLSPTDPVGWREHWAVGNLQGIYGNAGAIFGAGFGDPLYGLHIQIDTTNGIRFLDAGNNPYSSWAMDGTIRIGYVTAPNITIAPTGNIELRNGAAPTMTLEAGTGNLSLTGNLRSGATAFGLGIGYWLGWNGGTPQMRIGNPSGNRFEWDGSNLTILSGNVQIDPSNGITVQGVPGATFPPAASYGYNVTWRTYGGTSAMWGWEGSLTRKIEISNETGTATNAAAAIRLFVLGHGPLGTMSASLDLESFNGQQSLFRALCSDVQLGWTGGNVLAFKGGANESFRFATGGGSAGHLIPMTVNQDLGDPGHQWRYGWITTGLGIAIGAAVPGYQLHLGGDSAGKPLSSTWTVTSDISTKHAIDRVDPIAALATVRKVPIVRYLTNGDDLPAIGVIAQDVAALLPLSVKARAIDGLLDFNAHELLMLNVAAVQALAARLDAMDKDTSR